jgi:hypothetical protein
LVVLLERLIPEHREGEPDPSRGDLESRRALSVLQYGSAFLAGVLLPLALAGLAQHLESGGDIDARSYIKPGRHVVHAHQTEVFSVKVPEYRTHLIVSFAVQQAGTGSDNCVNGAALTLARGYGATTIEVHGGGLHGQSYAVPIPPGAREFNLLVTFIPQAGFSHCAEHIAVVSARFHS